MPIITVETGMLTAGQKKELIAELTEAASRITKIPPQSFIVLLKEIEDENVGVGGEPLPEVKARRQQC